MGHNHNAYAEEEKERREDDQRNPHTQRVSSKWKRIIKISATSVVTGENI